ncbi:hypothetical protein EV363DRAFT_1179996 [Boletus edulis]|uniref:Uncharacterized protein n=1 Tax=Boletus edulis BED1 TaxID=1328754 RepID=A0AAD4GAH4_BOLED|nr:hypothetical protein EV363DRAFT_1179996 [Boletus edulis]KAF8434107.1 hypothetical protein L210DRAFT_2669347 [Boletus edulis BED1]
MTMASNQLSNGPLQKVGKSKRKSLQTARVLVQRRALSPAVHGLLMTRLVPQPISRRRNACAEKPIMHTNRLRPLAPASSSSCAYIVPTALIVSRKSPLTQQSQISSPPSLNANVLRDTASSVAFPPSSARCLWDLDISPNTITEFPEEIGRLTALEKLVFVGNQVSRLPKQCSQLVGLRFLDCRRNSINDLSVAHTLPGLETLLADHNIVHALDLSHGPNSTDALDISFNDITLLKLDLSVQTRFSCSDGSKLLTHIIIVLGDYQFPSGTVRRSL